MSQEERRKTVKEVVKFLIDTPVEVTLQFEDGKRVEGRYGDQVMYSLTDNRVMYVPLYVEQRLQELAIGAGEPLLLCKKVVKEGSRNRTEWSVRRAPQPPLAPADGTSAMDVAASDATLDLRPLWPTDDSEIAARSEEGTSDEHHNAALVREETNHTSVVEQPSGNSTAPMAQELALHTNSQHQRQDSAGGTSTEIVLASAPSTKTVCSCRR